METTPEQLFHENIALAKWVANRYTIPKTNATIHVDEDDLYQLAYLGLWNACRSFDPARGFKFSTYATYQIKAPITYTVREATYLKRGAHAETVSLNQYAKNRRKTNGNQDTIADLVEDLSHDETALYVNEFMQSLTKRQRQILMLKLDGYTVRQIATKLNISTTTITRETHYIQDQFQEVYAV